MNYDKLLISGSTLILAASANAAPIDWITEPTTVTDETAISTVGTFVHAGTWGSIDHSVTIGDETIVFSDAAQTPDSPPVPGAGDSISTGAGENGNLTYFIPTGVVDPDFEAVMDSFAYDGPNPKIIVLSNLTVGQSYQVQLFVSDDRSFGATRRQYWSDNEFPGEFDANETLDFAQSDSTHTIGLFVADATTQNIYAHGAPQTVVNAYILRELVTGDADGDGLPNYWEEAYTDPPSQTGLDPNGDLEGGGTGDGLTNLQEFENGGNPLSSDTDDDGLSDGDEFHTHNTKIDNKDTDSDGLNDFDEIMVENSDPLVEDTDEDGVVDGLDDEPINPDNDDDEDGLTNIDETLAYFSDPLIPDSDGDGISDGDEVNIYDTDPTFIDSDGDDFPDNIEINRDTDPNDFDDFPTLVSIAWNTAQNITGNLSDISRNGNLIAAYNNGGTELLVAGITFQSDGLSLGAAFGTADPYDRGGDLDYETLLTSATWTPTATFIELDGLTPGSEYELQIWVADTRECCTGRVRTFTTDPVFQELELETEVHSGVFGEETNFPGQFVTGTFTASATSEYLLAGSVGLYGPQINAMQIRDLSGFTPPSEVIATEAGFNGTSFEITYTGLDSTKSYILRRNSDLTDSTEQDIGSPVTPTSATMSFSDPAPPAGTGARAFYHLEEVGTP